MRARSLKPGFFKNEKLAELHPLARLLFAGLWLIADREGRLDDRPKRIKAECLPYDNCNTEKLLRELASFGFILRYAANGENYIQIINFAKHQDPHVKERSSTIPAPCSHSASTVQKPLTPDSGLLTPDSIEERGPEHCAEAPNGVLPHVWKNWIAHRGNRLSKESIRRQTERLDELQALGHDKNAVLMQSMERGWSGLFEVKAQASQGQRRQTHAERRAANIAQLTGTANADAIASTATRIVDATTVRETDSHLRLAHDANVG